MDLAPNTVRVVVADDEPMRRAGYVAYLEHTDGITVVGEASDGAQAIHMTLATHPDVVLMDVLMPVVDGIEATRQLLDGHEATSVLRPRVIMMSGTDGDQYAYEAIRAGAAGFLPKDVGPDELAEAIRIVAADDALLAPGPLLRLIGEFTQPDPYRVDLVELALSLSEEERRLVTAVASGFTDAEVADHFGVEAKVVTALVAEVRAKLELADRTRLVLFGVEKGMARPRGDLPSSAHAR